MTLFAGREDAHGTHGEPQLDGIKWKINTTARTLLEPPTADHWRAHLGGTRPLGVIPIRRDSTCFWGCIDVDRYDVDVLEIVERVARSGLPLASARSKSGGLRVYMFMIDAQPAAAVQATLGRFAAKLGLADCEIFPKQSEVLADRGDVGNWMVMPYYGGTYGGKIREQVGLLPGGAEQTVEQFLTTAEALRLTAADFSALGHVRGERGTKSDGVAVAPFADGPPCLEHLAGEGVADGRKRALFHMGLYLKRMDPAGWRPRLAEANAAYMRPPLDNAEVRGQVRSLGKKDYEYTCREEPMCSHCDAALCRTRRFGVGSGGEFPKITGLRKLESEPPVWFLSVGGRTFEASTEELFNYDRMLIVFGGQGNRVYRLMKRDAWLAMLAEAVEELQVVPAPPDAGHSGRLREVMEDLLVNSWRGEHREDLLRGKPWEDEEAGRHYFRMQDLQKRLEREGIRGMTRGQLANRIEEMGGGHDNLKVKTKTVAVWYLPVGEVEPDPPIPPPKPNGGAI